ncbi:MAG: RluA family pseudouridine synthase [bacterium]|nr:RluA family pseudouridine synthase [bacterium]
MEPEIIYENNDFLVINKPNGLLVHPTIKNEKNTLVDWLIKRYPEIKAVGDNVFRPGIVHRLDKETSGIMIIAKNQKFFDYLKNLFKTHKIKKIYLALVWGKITKKHGIINLPISLKSGSIKRTIYKGKLQKQAITKYKLLKIFKNKKGDFFSLLEIYPLTGRTHQIRVHLKAINHPICGDKLYGKKNDNFKRLMLHALSIEFSFINGKIIKIETDIPKSFKKIV